MQVSLINVTVAYNTFHTKLYNNLYQKYISIAFFPINTIHLNGISFWINGFKYSLTLMSIIYAFISIYLNIFKLI